jgi:hypothetical protein
LFFSPFHSAARFPTRLHIDTKSATRGTTGTSPTSSVFELAKVAKMAKWDNIRDDLFEAIIQVMGTINKEQQTEIVNIMRAKGHDMGWNAIRYVVC